MGIFDFFRKKEPEISEEQKIKDAIDELEINFQNKYDHEQYYEEDELENREIAEKGRAESRDMKEEYESYIDYDDFMARPDRDSFYGCDDER